MKAFLAVFLGVSSAQAITLLLSPLLSRLYSPAEFGMYWTFVGIVSLVGVGIACRYEYALGLPERDEEASAVAFGALLLTLVLALLLPLGWHAIAFAAPTLMDKPSFAQFGQHAYWIAAATALFGAFQVVNLWLTRKGLFRQLSLAKVIQAAIAGLLALALYRWSVSGWILAYLLGFAGAVAWGYAVSRRNGLRLWPMLPGAVAAEMARYKQFPMNAVPAIMDAAGNWFPVLFVAAVFQTDFVGQFTLSRQMLGAPLSLVAAAVTPVLYKRLIARSQDGLQLVPQLGMYAVVLAAIGIAAIPVIVLWGGNIFAFVFGARWREAGDISGILIFAYAVRFVGSSLSISLVSLGAMRALSAWQIASFAVIAAVCLLPYDTPQQFLYAYVAAEVGMYALYVLTSFWFAMRHDRALPHVRPQAAGRI